MRPTFAIPLLAVTMATPGFASETRQLGAHEHGVSELGLAIDGRTVAMELQAPGADIVGFEHAAESAEDRAAVDDAVALLARPLELFVLPAAAGCSVTSASATLRGDAADEDHAAHGHDAHAHDHASEKTAHAGHDHDDHDHAEDAGHTEFHAAYTLDCAAPEAITEVVFAFFDRFANAREIEVQVVTSRGAASFEVTREAPVLDLGRLPQS